MQKIKLNKVVAFEKDEGDLVALLNNERNWSGLLIESMEGPNLFTSNDDDLHLIAWEEPPFSWTLGVVESEADSPWCPTKEQRKTASISGTGVFRIPECIRVIKHAKEIQVGQEVTIPNKFYSPDATFGYNKKEDVYYHIITSREPNAAIHLGKGLYLLMDGKEVVGIVLTHAQEAYDNAGKPKYLTI